MNTPLRGRGVLTNVGRFDNQPILAVKRKAWRMDDEHASESDEEFGKLRLEILHAGSYTCHFCGFRCSKWQEVHHINDDHRDNSPQNLMPICTLCHQVHHMGLAAMRGSAFFAYLPELTQTEVNQIALIAHVSPHVKGNTDESNEQIRSLYALLQSRGPSYLKQAAKTDLDFEIEIARWASECSDAEFEQRARKLDGIRLVPTANAFHDGQLLFYATQLKASFAHAELQGFYKNFITSFSQ